MNTKQKNNILKVQANLLKISLTGKAPINIAQYEKLDLVKAINKTVTLSCGEKEIRFDKLVLTNKGKRILEATF